MTLEKALQTVKEEYERAKELKFIHNPLAWALHKVWRMVDGGK